MSQLYSPRKPAYLRVHKNPMQGQRTSQKLKFGVSGVFATTYGYLHWRNIEAGRRFMTRQLKRAKVWIKVRLTQPITAKSKQSRMGKGKGKFKGWVGFVRPGTPLYEMGTTNKAAITEHRSPFTRMTGIFPFERLHQKLAFGIKVIRSQPKRKRLYVKTLTFQPTKHKEKIYIKKITVTNAKCKFLYKIYRWINQLPDTNKKEKQLLWILIIFIEKSINKSNHYIKIWKNSSIILYQIIKIIEIFQSMLKKINKKVFYKKSSLFFKSKLKRRIKKISNKINQKSIKNEKKMLFQKLFKLKIILILNKFSELISKIISVKVTFAYYKQKIFIQFETKSIQKENEIISFSLSNLNKVKKIIRNHTNKMAIKVKQKPKRKRRKFRRWLRRRRSKKKYIRFWRIIKKKRLRWLTTKSFVNRHRSKKIIPQKLKKNKNFFDNNFLFKLKFMFINYISNKNHIFFFAPEKCITNVYFSNKIYGYKQKFSNSSKFRKKNIEKKLVWLEPNYFNFIKYYTNAGVRFKLNKFFSIWKLKYYQASTYSSTISYIEESRQQSYKKNLSSLTENSSRLGSYTNINWWISSTISKTETSLRRWIRNILLQNVIWNSIYKAKKKTKKNISHQFKSAAWYKNNKKKISNEKNKIIKQTPEHDLINYFKKTAIDYAKEKKKSTNFASKDFLKQLFQRYNQKFKKNHNKKIKTTTTENKISNQKQQQSKNLVTHKPVESRSLIEVMEEWKKNN